MEEVLTPEQHPPNEVALQTDQLLERTPMHRCLDLASELFLQAPLYSLAHVPGRLLGPIEQRRIISSFLSRQCQDGKKLARRAFFYPSGARTLHVPCTTKLLFSFSRGAGHGARTCEKTYHLIYLYDWQALEQTRQTGWSVRWARPMLEAWAVKQLRGAQEIWVSHEKLANQLRQHGLDAVVVPPPLELQEFPLLPNNSLPQDYLVIHTQDLSLELALAFVHACEERKLRFVLVGAAPAWQQTQTVIDQRLFWGERCAGELAPLLAGARAVVDCSRELHPHLAIKAISCGASVMALGDSLPHGSFEPPAGGPSVENVGEWLDRCLNKKVDRQALHQSVQFYKEAFFRQKLLSKARSLKIDVTAS